MSKSKEILDDLAAAIPSIDPEIIIHAFEKKLHQFKLDDFVFVDNVEVGKDGDINITFLDEEGNPYVLVFSYDEKEGPQAFAITDDSDDKDDDKEDEESEDQDSSQYEFDLAPLNPVIAQTPMGSYINLGDLSWLDCDTMLSLLNVAGLGIEGCKIPHPKYDEFGNFLKNESIDEIYRTVVRAGKPVRINFLRRTRKRRLTAKQRAGIRRGVMKRKREKNQIQRNRRKSALVRKRRHLKPSHLPPGFKARR